MRRRSRFVMLTVLLLALSLYAWAEPPAIDAPAKLMQIGGGQAGRPQIDSTDPHRFVRDGIPWYPVGYTPNLGALTRRCDGVKLDAYYKALHTWLQSRGINYYRAVFTFGQAFAGQPGDACAGRQLTAAEETLPYQRTGPGTAADGRPKYNLDQWNDAHFTYWANVLADAASKGIVIELSIFDSFHNNRITHTKPATLGWGQLYDFYHGDNNVNGVTFTLSNASEATWHNRDTSSPIFLRQKALVQKVELELGGFDNLILEICNEPDDYVWASEFDIYIASNKLVVQRELDDHKQTIPNGLHDHVSLHGTLAQRFFSRLPEVPLTAHNDCADATCLTSDLLELRQRGWAALTAGGHYNHLFNLDEKSAFDPGTSTDLGALHLSFVGKFLQDLDVDLRGMTPSDHLVSSPSTNGAWTYARAGAEYVVYKRKVSGIGGSTNQSVTVSGLSGGHAATWFNPRTGTAGPTVTGTSVGTAHRFDPPTDPDLEWALHILQAPAPEIDVPQVDDGDSFTFEPSPSLDGLPVSRWFDICNVGSATLVISNPTVLVSGTGFTQLLAPASSVVAGACTGFRVRFNVTAAGSYIGAVSIVNNDSDENPYDFTLHADAIGDDPDIRVIQVPDGGSFDFGLHDVADLPTSRLFDICNDGVGQLSIGNPTDLVSGTGFSQLLTIPSETPPSTLASGACAKFRVRFNANVAGSFSGAVSITNNDPDENPYDFTLLGQATLAPPEIRVVRRWDGVPIPDGGSFDFGSYDVADLPTSRVFDLCNDGAGPLSIGNPTNLVSGTGFSQLLDIPSEIPPDELGAGVCTKFRVRFHVDVAGSYAGAVLIVNNDPDENPYDFALLGQATVVPPEIRVVRRWDGVLVPDGGSFDFGVHDVAQLPTSRVFDICNDGPGPLTLGNPTSLVSGSGFSQLLDIPSEIPPPTLDPGACTPFRVRYHVNGAGSHSGVVSITNNDSDENPYDFSLSGTAIN